jgi:hypothetical protein
MSRLSEIDQRIANARRKLTLAEQRESCASGHGPERMRTAARAVAAAKRELDRALAAKRNVAALADRDPVALAMSGELAEMVSE